MSKPYKVLVVDDDNSITELLQYNLEQQGYIVQTVHNGKEALEVARDFQPNLVLLDIMMPGLDGVETCRLLRNTTFSGELFILFLTARAEEYSEIAAFDAGANDYIIKPVKPRALMSRISACFKRETTVQAKNNIITVRDITVDRESYTVMRNNEKITLAKKEFELLYFLCQHPNKIFNRDELLKKVWGTDVCVVSRTIDVHIRKIREKIGDDLINTVKGIGYKLEISE